MALAEQIRSTASESGYPERPFSRTRRHFDAESVAVLYERMRIAPAEAAAPGVWAFLGCVVLPDIVRWRLYDAENSTPAFRSLGDTRGLRNVFGRVWWRAYILRQPAAFADANGPYRLVERLGEDELVQIMERPNLSGNPHVAQAVASTPLEVAPSYDGPRSELLRDASKRLRRLLSVMSFDALDQGAICETVRDVFMVSLASLSRDSPHGTRAGKHGQPNRKQTH